MPLIVFCGCAALFVSDLVGNPKDKFSCDAAPSLYGSTDTCIHVLQAVEVEEHAQVAPLNITDYSVKSLCRKSDMTVRKPLFKAQIRLLICAVL